MDEVRGIRFGVNYVPRENWWYAWVDWDESSIRRDLESIASLGMDHLRIHLLWSVFQPNAGFVSPVLVQRVARLVEIADENGLGVFVTVLDGWLSGFEFYPAWLKRWNMFTQTEAVMAEKRLFERLARELSGAPNFLGFDLGNELGVLQGRYHQVTVEEADAWQKDLLDYCDEIAPGRSHVNGVDHQHWFADLGFSRPGLATQGAMTVLHSWAYFSGAMERYGPHGIGSMHLVEFQAELARAYHLDLQRPIWVQEIGASTFWMKPEAIPNFAEDSIRNALSCESIWGITWWCSHDLQPHIEGLGLLEYDLGLIDSSGAVKPIGKRIASLIQEFRNQPPQPLKRGAALVITEESFGKPGESKIWKFGEAFMALVAQGVRPAIVHQSRAEDQTYLKSRGIGELIMPEI